MTTGGIGLEAASHKKYARIYCSRLRPPQWHKHGAMNRFSKASRPVTWPAPRRPQDGNAPMASPAPARGPCPSQLIPSFGGRGKGLLNIPPAAGRPAVAGMKGGPKSSIHQQEPILSHAESLRIHIRPRPRGCPPPFTISSCRFRLMLLHFRFRSHLPHRVRHRRQQHLHPRRRMKSRSVKRLHRCTISRGQ